MTGGDQLTLEKTGNQQQWDDILAGHLERSLSDHVPQLDAIAMLQGVKNYLGRITGIVEYLYVENEYNETAWKNMISFYYVNNASVIKTTVMRIHMFKGKRSSYNLAEENDIILLRKNYLGFFNLRPIPESDYCVSYVMLNYRNIPINCVYDNGIRTRLRMLTYERIVHLRGIEIPIDTFPFFGRDNKMVVCAQADMLMLSRYIYRKLNMPELTLRNICQARIGDKPDLFPTHGLTIPQMLQIFYSREIPVRQYSCSVSEQGIEDQTASYSAEIIGCLIHSYLDSGIPVLLLKDRHVVIANGISTPVLTDNGESLDRLIAIYDDSGALITDIRKKHVPDVSFLGITSWSDIKEYLWNKRTASEHEIENDLQVVAPLYQRITLDYPEFISLILNANILDGFVESEELESPDLLLESKVWSRIRTFLLDCNELKTALLRNKVEYWNAMEKDLQGYTGSDADQARIIIQIQKYLMERIMNSGIPHYYWCLEIPVLTEGKYRYYYYFFSASPVTQNNELEISRNLIERGKIKEILLDNRGFSVAAIDMYLQEAPSTVNNAIMQPFVFSERIMSS